MRNIKTGIMTLLLMGSLGMISIQAAYGPGVRVPGGPGDSDPGREIGNVYLYPGWKGKGPYMLNMINSFLGEEYDDDDDNLWKYEQGWHYSPNGWWYLLGNGSWPAGGWRCIDYRWYYFMDSGIVYTGWLEEGGSKYYLNPVDDGTYGAMRIGWQIIDGKAYYFNASSDGILGALLTNTTTPDGYQVGADGAMIIK